MLNVTESVIHHQEFSYVMISVNPSPLGQLPHKTNNIIIDNTKIKYNLPSVSPSIGDVYEVYCLLQKINFAFCYHVCFNLVFPKLIQSWQCWQVCQLLIEAYLASLLFVHQVAFANDYFGILKVLVLQAMPS